MTSAVLLGFGLLVLLEAPTYHNFITRVLTAAVFFVFNILCYFVHQRPLVPFGLGVLLSCVFVCLCLLPTALYVYTESFK